MKEYRKIYSCVLNMAKLFAEFPEDVAKPLAEFTEDMAKPLTKFPEYMAMTDYICLANCKVCFSLYQKDDDTMFKR